MLAPEIPRGPALCHPSPSNACLSRAQLRSSAGLRWPCRCRSVRRRRRLPHSHRAPRRPPQRRGLRWPPPSRPRRSPRRRRPSSAPKPSASIRSAAPPSGPGRSTSTPPTSTRGIKLAKALRALGRYDEAGQTADQVLVMQPGNYEALLESARDQDRRATRASTPSIDGAARRGHRAQGLAPGQPAGDGARAVGTRQEALAAHQKALALAPDNAGDPHQPRHVLRHPRRSGAGRAAVAQGGRRARRRRRRSARTWRWCSASRAASTKPSGWRGRICRPPRSTTTSPTCAPRPTRRVRTPGIRCRRLSRPASAHPEPAKKFSPERERKRGLAALGQRSGTAQAREGRRMIGDPATRRLRRRLRASSLGVAMGARAKPPVAFPPGSATAKLIAETALYSLDAAAADGAICRAVCPVRHFRAHAGLI